MKRTDKADKPDLRAITAKIQSMSIEQFASNLLPLETGKWTPWPVQRRIWAAIKAEARINVLKTRQTGGTRASVAAVVRQLIANGGKYAVVLHVQPALETVYELLQSWLGPDSPLSAYGATVTQRGVTIAPDRARGIIGGSIRLSTAGSGGARGGTFAGVVLSEFAYYADPGPYIEAIKPALDRSRGWCIIESTPSGPGGAHETVCTSPDWTQIRGYWHECPDCRTVPPIGWSAPAELQGYPIETAYWYYTRYSSAIDRTKFLRENPATDEEAFASAGGTYFDASQLVNPIRTTDPVPAPGHHYLIGLDVGLGKGGDYTAFCMLDSLTGKQVLSWATNTATIEQTAARAAMIARTWNGARICVDATGLGAAMVQALTTICGYRNLEEFVFSRSSKSTLWARARAIIPHLGPLDAETLTELRALITDPHGSPIGPPGAHDDRAMALALAIRAGGEHWIPQPTAEYRTSQPDSVVDYRRGGGERSRLGLPSIRSRSRL